MRILLLICLLAFSPAINAAEDFYELKAKKIDGDTLHFSELKGKKLMIVNVASYCGYTFQYQHLQSLYQQYGGEKFEIIAFPANNFGNQEPGTDEDIKNFCTDNYGVTFTMMSKISVKGTDKHPVYQWLTQKSKNGVIDQEVNWNFQKYLISENGVLWRIFSTQTSPMHQDIIDWLEEDPNSVNIQKPLETISIFPNPASDFIEISQPSEGFNPSEGSEIKIYNIYGVCVIYLTPNPSPRGEGSVRIDVSHLPAGAYYLRAGNSMKMFVKTGN